MTTLSSTDRAAQERILAAVADKPGSTQVQLAEVVGEPEYRVRRVLSIAKRAEIVGFIRIGGRTPTWWPVEMLQQAKADAKQAVEQAQREQRRAYANARWDRVRAELAESPELPPRPIRRQADPAAPLPFVCTAPASVFHLAASLSHAFPAANGRGAA